MKLFHKGYVVEGNVDEILEFIRKSTLTSVTTDPIYTFHGQKVQWMSVPELIKAILIIDPDAGKNYDLDTLTKEELINILNANSAIRNI